MEKNVYKKLCGNINYNTYTDIRNTLLTSTLGLTVANVLIPYCPLIYNSYFIDCILGYVVDKWRSTYKGC